jgi:hypothetical protein
MRPHSSMSFLPDRVYTTHATTDASTAGGWLRSTWRPVPMASIGLRIQRLSAMAARRAWSKRRTERSTSTTGRSNPRVSAPPNQLLRPRPRRGRWQDVTRGPEMHGDWLEQAEKAAGRARVEVPPRVSKTTYAPSAARAHRCLPLTRRPCPIVICALQRPGEYADATGASSGSSVDPHPVRNRPSTEGRFVMSPTGATGFEPAVFGLTGRHVNHYTTPPTDGTIAQP